MTMHLRRGVLTIEAQSDASLCEWLDAHSGQVFRLRSNKHGALVFHSLGLEEEACRVPLNITSRSPMPLRLISNFAHAPFILDGISYASVEGFWQGLKFPDGADRRRLASLHGSEAKDAGFYAPPADEILYQGRTIRVGTFDHWELMELACSAKFEQNEPHRRALLDTGTRPLVHQMKRDSRTIPGVIMADMWMRLRERLRGKNA
jgi:predicted NAD-dependent protein-ADP-ribosyltransferase YbiA (DUF1768 family)